MSKRKNIIVKGLTISIEKIGKEDFISLTDIARNKNSNEPKDVVKNWLRSKSTIEFLGLWEQLNNPGFKGVDFDPLLFEAGSNAFTLSPTKWIETTGAKGIITKSGNNGGTFGHRDIAFEFASWVNPAFKLYLIKEFQRLKEKESDSLHLEWDLQRTLSKINYHIHTDAIKQNLIPPEITKKQQGLIYASEADLLNVALFGKTVIDWRKENSKMKGNIRDHATLEQLIVLTNLESLNSVLINQGLDSGERILQLNKIAIQQLKTLLTNTSLKKLKQK